MKYLLSDERDRANRLKRGGGADRISLDDAEGERRYRLEPIEELTPERVYERAWVATLLERAACRLRREYAAAGKGELHDHLRAFRLDASGQPAYAEVAERLGQTESAVKSAIWRLRQRHRELVREEISQTLDDGADVDDEIRYLLQVVGAGRRR
jgi:RNA polymerase sigma-70 factor (ECF subfamily)